MRQRPRGEGVGGETLVHQRQGALHVRGGDVGEHRLDLRAGQHALVHQRARGEAGDVEQIPLAQVGVADGVLDAPADDVQPPLEGHVVKVGRAADENLLEGGLAGPRRGTDFRIVGRHVAPAERDLVLVADDLLEPPLAPLRLRRIARQEDEAAAVLAGRRQPDAGVKAHACGIWMRMPTPSPVFSSHPQAPRCRRFFRMVMPCSTMACDFRPLMCTTKPTPQASCSNAGSYRPRAAGLIVGPPPSVDSLTTAAPSKTGGKGWKLYRPVTGCVTAPAMTAPSPP